ncbi:MAG: tyrosine-type recombinase/integrase [Candidatus Bathyarchaeia archaeon]
MVDVHGYSRRLQSARRRLTQLRHSDLLLAFVDHLLALGLSEGRVAKVANHLCTLFRSCPFNPSKATVRDVEGVVGWINNQPYKSSTKDDLRLVVRKIVQYAKLGSCARKTPVPPEVAWFSVRTRDDRDSRVKPENLLTIDEVKRMMAAAENERDRALVSVLFEAALRPGELLGMTIGSVQFKEGYCLISVVGKTGVKRIPLVASFKPLIDWLQKHPERGDPKAPLWASLSNNSKGGRVSYAYLRRLLKRLAKKAGIAKDVWPYLFRHTALTNMAKILTEARLELYAGWVQGSRMTRRYVHFSARDLEEAILQLHGLEEGKRHEDVLKTAECPRCKTRNAPDAVRCNFCGLVLDRRLAEKMEEEERRKDEAIMARIEQLEQLVRSLLNGQNASPPKASSNHPTPATTSPDQPAEQQQIPRSLNHQGTSTQKLKSKAHETAND